MKILVYMQNLSTGGAERTILNIVKGLKGKHEIIFVLGKLTDNSYDDLLLKMNVKIIVLNKSKTRGSILSLSRIIYREKPDILFSTLTSNNIALALSKILSFRRTPLVLRVTNNTENQKISLFKRLYIRFIYNLFAKKIVSLSAGVQEDLINNYKIKQSKIVLIYNPVDLEYIADKKNEKINIEHSLLFKENLTNIINVGRLVEQKNQKLLIDSAIELRKSNKSFNVIIIGDGPLKNKLIRYVDENLARDYIHFLGYQKNPYKFLRKSDIFVLTSKWEGFGHVIVEAMATNNSVISVDCKSGPKGIIGENYGILVNDNVNEISKAILDIINDPVKKENLVKQGLQRAKDFSLKKIVREYETMFHSINKKKIKK